MANWQDQFSPAELAEYQRNYSARELADTTPCHGCGTPTPYVLLDGKPPEGTPEDDLESADFTVLLCRSCYGPGWCET